MTEEQKYKVEERFPRFEVRRYEPCVVADVQVTANFESAGNIGFGPLFGYISGNNNPKLKISMTTPVFQAPVTRTAILEPVMQKFAEDRNIISFVMPANIGLDALPTPNNPVVSLREIPEQLVAVMTMSGRWGKSNCQKYRSEEHTSELQSH